MAKVEKKKIKYYELLECKKAERGFGYSKHSTTVEKTIKKSTNIYSLIEELEKKYKGQKDEDGRDKTEWAVIPKCIIYRLLDELKKDKVFWSDSPFEYEKNDYIIVKSEMEENEMIEGVDYVQK